MNFTTLCFQIFCHFIPSFDRMKCPPSKLLVVTQMSGLEDALFLMLLSSY